MESSDLSAAKWRRQLFALALATFVAAMYCASRITDREAQVQAAGSAFPSHPSPGRSEVGRAALLLGLFGGFLGLTVQTLFDYAIASAACFVGRIPSAQPASAWAWWSMATGTGVGALIAAASFVIAYWSWVSVRKEVGLQHHDSHERDLLETGEGRTRYLAMGGMIVSAVMLSAIVFHGMVVVTAGVMCRTII